MRARSVLFLPASSPRAMEKARTLDCDVAVLDLEDAVAPDRKEDARAAAVDAVRSGGLAPRLGVRVNGAGTPWHADDLAALAAAGCDLIVLPKVEDAATAVRAAGAVPQARLIAMIETPVALFRLTEIAGAHAALDALMFGVNDLAAALGTGASDDREPLKPWLAATVAAARACGVAAIDGVYNRHQDDDGFGRECAQGALYGFDGKSLIHPRQIAAANAAFSPSPDAVSRARAVVAAFDAPGAQGRGAISLDGEMLERLHLEAARRTLAKAGK
ncbi:MAG TPA: CoA ester lyase [Brevundimonas sp.]|jgi:citrate lyase subunit beta/citryl-CoA lyase|uniref:HpcH/HpaI aldolase/citrate lyase family protein n=1 Tax=Brevundimonas sp. TaxID=1871086 RepID=UPI002DEDBD6D|nr:CoA ester lyase [Brevundimonas sp.]